MAKVAAATVSSASTTAVNRICSSLFMGERGGPAARRAGRIDRSFWVLSNSGATLTAMGEKLSPSEGRGYLIIKRIRRANYNNWKLASDYGISSCICINADSTVLVSTWTADIPLLPVVLLKPDAKKRWFAMRL